MPTDFATSPATAVQTPREFDGGFVRARVEQPMGAARCADCIEQTS